MMKSSKSTIPSPLRSAAHAASHESVRNLNASTAASVSELLGASAALNLKRNGTCGCPRSASAFQSFEQRRCRRGKAGRPEAFAYWNYVSSIGAFLSFASILFFIGIIAYTLLAGRRVTENNYWNEYADTLEWTLPSPPPEHTFEQLPKQEDWDKPHAH